MKYTTVYLDENKIELFNTILGKETIKVNGEIVSEKDLSQEQNISLKLMKMEMMLLAN